MCLTGNLSFVQWSAVLDVFLILVFPMRGCFLYRSLKEDFKSFIFVDVRQVSREWPHYIVLSLHEGALFNISNLGIRVFPRKILRVRIIVTMETRCRQKCFSNKNKN